MSTVAAGSIALPLDNEQTASLHQAVAGLSPGQLQWVSGYLAGLAAAGSSVPVPGPNLADAAKVTGDALTILVGSQTGNGEGVAAQLAQCAREQGFAVNLRNLANFKPASLKREALAVFVVSTHGEGDPRDDAELFHEYILSSKASGLANLK